MSPEVLEPFLRRPGACAVLLDVDGTLAPIAAHPAAAAVPPETLALLTRAVTRFALVGCVSGRPARDVARLVPVPGVVVSGNHGLELLDDDVLHTAPEVDRHLGDIRDLLRALTPVAAGAGAWIEDKGATLAVHYRQAPDPAWARAVLELEGEPLVAEHGLEARFGRMVFEVRPPVPIDKGSAVRRILRGRRLERSLYAGDDRTDIDAFRVVDVPVAVRSAEAPAELEDAAAVVVDGVEGMRELLRRLVG
ncbi:MAG: Trehalose-6-phosphate phosphatase, partial [uncultured Thermoleophilia bacterium]